jgi:glycerol-3-phosphate acyltransferase PlsX
MSEKISQNKDSKENLNNRSTSLKKKEEIVIAVDAMGGDNAPSMVFKGLSRFSKKNNDVRFRLFGDKEILEQYISSYPKLKDKSEIVHTNDVIKNEDKPSLALRRGKTSSMGKAILAVKDGEAQAAVSSGNTGALMALAKFTLQTLPAIDRPAICALMPSENDEFVTMLDLGANIHCDAENLYEFAIMGEAFSRAITGKERPSIGLLNVGSEKNKGHEVLRLASNLIEEYEPNLNYYGYIEGDDIYKGTTDVIVTDGFTGNIALKTAEGTAKFYTKTVKKILKRSPFGLLGMGIALPSLCSVKKKMDPRNYNGAMFLGLNGIVVKSHGGTDHIGFANALNVAYKLAYSKINDQITKEMMLSPNSIEKDDIDINMDSEI